MNINSENKRKPELLAPAGDFAALKAAVGNGADAVYIGASLFSARARAGNFSDKELVDAIDHAHLRSVKVHLALNTLLTNDEIDNAVEIAAMAWRQGVDAVIVQDMGLAAKIRRIIPDIVLHASTQATIYDENALQACSEIGFSRIILPREMDIEDISGLTRRAHELNMGTEVFIHGALCVCYSGQCLMSGAMGGRSGNRGECAQPCRLEYELETNGKGSGKSFPRLGLKDMADLRHIDALTDAGVDSFKIEGRMRSPDYVGIVTGVYRKVIDEGVVRDEDERDLLLAYNRGGRFTDHYVRGVKSDDKMTGARTGSHGIQIGEVIAMNSRLGVVEYAAKDMADMPGKGDVVSVRRISVADEICSAPVSEPVRTANGVRIKGFHPDVIERIKPGDKVFRMNDTAGAKTAAEADIGKTLIKGVFESIPGSISIRWEVVGGPSTGLASEYVIEHEVSDKYQPVSSERCAAQLSRTGDTAFETRDIMINGEPAVPVSLLNRLRRESLDVLSGVIIESFKRDVSSVSAFVERSDGAVRESGSMVSVYLYDWDGEPETLDCGADIYELPVWSFLSEKAFDSVRKLKLKYPDTRVAICLPPAYNGKTGELLEPVMRKIGEAGSWAVLSGNPGNRFLAESTGSTDMRDSSANVFNSYAAAEVFRQGAFSLVPSQELHFDRIKEIVSDVPYGCFELPAYGRIRLMYSEHCPVGYNRPGCTICHRDARFRLKDRKGSYSPVVCHPEVCTSEILSPDILCAPGEVVKATGGAGVIARLYFYDESIETRRELVELMRTYLTEPDGDAGARAALSFRAAALREGVRTDSYVGTSFYSKGII
ncbi:MAG: U32 family peptidase [Eubacteriales bacterium]|nr:U32 family peptidase [Eubacteriales bacterium]